MCIKVESAVFYIPVECLFGPLDQWWPEYTIVSGVEKVMGAAKPEKSIEVLKFLW